MLCPLWESGVSGVIQKQPGARGIWQQRFHKEGKRVPGGPDGNWWRLDFFGFPYCY